MILIYFRPKSSGRSLVHRKNCHRGKASVVLWGQLPMLLCMSVTPRNMAMMMENSNNISISPSTYNVLFRCPNADVSSFEQW